MDTLTPTDQMVSIDAGDLEEVMQAAEAWASNRRETARLHHQSGAPGQAKTATETADRIDKALNRCRQFSFQSLQERN